MFYWVQMPTTKSIFNNPERKRRSSTSDDVDCSTVYFSDYFILFYRHILNMRK